MPITNILILTVRGSDVYRLLDSDDQSRSRAVGVKLVMTDHLCQTNRENRP